MLFRSETITKVYGAYHGIKGVLNDQLMIMDEEDPKELELLLSTPSSALGSCRYKIADPDVDDTDFKRILEIFQKYNVRYFFYNGGIVVAKIQRLPELVLHPAHQHRAELRTQLFHRVFQCHAGLRPAHIDRKSTRLNSSHIL